MKTNFDMLKELDATSFAIRLVFDNDGNMRTCCAICQRYFDGNCDDNCISGIIEYLKSEVKNG